jgi:hypothetical protein
MMTDFEKAKQIQNIYDEAIKKLDALEGEKKQITKKYIEELEAQKIDAIRASIELLFDKKE